VEEDSGSGGLGHFDGPVVVAVVAVRVVKVTADQVVDVLAVRDRLVAAVRPVFVFGIVVGAVVAGRAVGGIGLADRQYVALDPARAVVVQLAVVEVIQVIVVADGGVTAAWAVLVVVYLGGHAVTFPCHDVIRARGRHVSHS
jgi:hypothetical protein